MIERKESTSKWSSRNNSTFKIKKGERIFERRDEESKFV
jgi:hypothetical protein